MFSLWIALPWPRPGKAASLKWLARSRILWDVMSVLFLSFSFDLTAHVNYQSTIHYVT